MIKDIIVHLDGSADDAVRILHAERIAASFGAHIRGLYANILPEVPLAMAEDATVAPAVAASQDEARTNGDLIEQALTRRFEKLAAPAELRRFDLFADALWKTVASRARTADLFVELKPYRSDQPDCWPEVIEAALFASGRSVYVVPESAAPAGHEIKTVLLAWNDTREAARALAGAMPFLERAQEAWSPWWTATAPRTRKARNLAPTSRVISTAMASKSSCVMFRTGTAHPTPSSTRSGSLTRTLSWSAPTAIPASANGLSAASRGVF